MSNVWLHFTTDRTVRNSFPEWKLVLAPRVNRLPAPKGYCCYFRPTWSMHTRRNNVSALEKTSRTKTGIGRALARRILETSVFPREHRSRRTVWNGTRKRTTFARTQNNRYVRPRMRIVARAFLRLDAAVITNPVAAGISFYLP